MKKKGIKEQKEVLSDLELTEEQVKRVQPHIPTITMMLAFYKRFGKDALEVSRDWAFRSGKARGEEVKRRMNIQGTDARAIETLFNSILSDRYDEETIKKKLVRLSVEGNKFIAINEGFCPIMTAVKMLNAPWNIVCENYSWPFHHGMAAAINPSVKQEIPKIRIRGDEYCEHMVIVQEQNP